MATKKSPKPEAVEVVLEDEPCCPDKACEACEDCPLPDLVSPVEAPAPVERPRTHLVVAGDSYASIAAAYKPSGVTGHAYAKDLLAANAGKPLRPGVTVLL